MKNNKIGISSACFFPQDTLLSLIQCAKLGFTCAEIFVNTDRELSGEYFRNTREFVKSSNTEIISIHPYTSSFEPILFFAGYDTRVEDGIEYYKKYFNYAAELGAEYVIFHGDSKLVKRIPIEKYAEIFTRIKEAGAAYGIELLHENTTMSRMLYPENIAAFHKLLPNAHFCFDPKQSCRGDIDPQKALLSMGSAVAHVHINDWGNNECKLPLCGELNTEKFLHTLEDIDYKGAFIFEVYRHNFNAEEDISRSLLDFKKLLCKFSK